MSVAKTVPSFQVHDGNFCRICYRDLEYAGFPAQNWKKNMEKLT